MKIAFLLLVILLTSCRETEKIQGEIVELPQPFAAKDCVSLLHLSRPGLTKINKEVSRHDETYQAYSWRDTLFSDNESILRETYFGGFSLSLKRNGVCDWFGTLDSIRLDFQGSPQTIIIPQGAIYLRKYKGPDVEFFGNDTTIIQGFKITFDGLSGATGNMVYDYYLFDKETNRYTRDTALSKLPSAHVNLELGVVTSGWNGGHVGRIGGRSMYRLAENGQLEFMKTWHSVPEGDGYRVTRVEMKNGKRARWSGVVTQDEWQAAVWY